MYSSIIINNVAINNPRSVIIKYNNKLVLGDNLVYFIILPET